jgi:hypothetical protein
VKEQRRERQRRICSGVSAHQCVYITGVSLTNRPTQSVGGVGSRERVGASWLLPSFLKMSACVVRVVVRPSTHRVVVARPARAVVAVVRNVPRAAPLAAARSVKATLQRRRVRHVLAASSPAAVTQSTHQDGGPLRVIVVGAPGSGKGTQVRRIPNGCSEGALVSLPSWVDFDLAVLLVLPQQGSVRCVKHGVASGRVSADTC